MILNKGLCRWGLQDGTGLSYRFVVEHRPLCCWHQYHCIQLGITHAQFLTGTSPIWYSDSFHGHFKIPTFCGTYAITLYFHKTHFISFPFCNGIKWRHFFWLSAIISVSTVVIIYIDDECRLSITDEITIDPKKVTLDHTLWCTHRVLLCQLARNVRLSRVPPTRVIRGHELRVGRPNTSTC